MPIGLVYAYLDMMPRLRAEAQLETARVVRLGTSASMAIDDIKDLERALDREANPRRRQKPRRADAEMLAAMGIGIRSVQDEKGLSDG